MFTSYLQDQVPRGSARERRQLESAIASYDRLDPVPQARGDLQARLDDVIAEQDDRTRLAGHA